jgi:hypothetical protein
MAAAVCRVSMCFALTGRDWREGGRKKGKKSNGGNEDGEENTKKKGRCLTSPGTFSDTIPASSRKF